MNMKLSTVSQVSVIYVPNIGLGLCTYILGLTQTNSEVSNTADHVESVGALGTEGSLVDARKYLKRLPVPEEYESPGLLSYCHS